MIGTIAAIVVLAIVVVMMGFVAVGVLSGGGTPAKKLAAGALPVLVVIGAVAFFVSNENGKSAIHSDFASMRQRDDAIDKLTRLQTSDVAKSAQAMKRGQFAAAAKLRAAATAAADLRICIQGHAVYNARVVAACRR